MISVMSRWQALGLGRKLSAATLALMALALAVPMSFNLAQADRMSQDRATRQVVEQTRLVVQMIEATDRDLRARTDALAKAFLGTLDGPKALGTGTVPVGGRDAPVLTVAEQPLNLDTRRVDTFTAHTGAVATVFAKSGDDFVRIATSLKNPAGERVVGTLLDRQHPGYARVRDGQPYVGLAQLFGRQYMTRYDPLLDAQGRVVGLAFVGVDFSDHLTHLKDTLRQLRIGATGYFYVLDTRPGDTLGTAIVHPTREGQRLLGEADADGHAFIQDMLARQNGRIHYPWLNREAGETLPREKVVAFTTLADWHWMVAGGAYLDENTAELRTLARHDLLMSALALALVGGALVWMMRRLVTRPLRDASASADALARGDLRVRLTEERHDEVGDLARAINRIGQGLSDVVGRVRQNADAVATSCSEIAQGNQDLSVRTETQSGALQQTASSMEQLGATVRQNAERAQQARHLAQDASAVVHEGGEVVTRVVDTMKGIGDASHRIADIVGVIDGLSFQTNLLALNAAVEAARAGEQGRGFAVVANEVRHLASRSAEAAREVRQLIQDSVERAREGSALADQAGASMGRVVQSIERVTALVREIDVASQEQHGGVSQVGSAVSQIDSVTQQNAALVEQMAAAAASLDGQARDLVRSVSVFQTAA